MGPSPRGRDDGRVVFAYGRNPAPGGGRWRCALAVVACGIAGIFAWAHVRNDSPGGGLAPVIVDNAPVVDEAPIVDTTEASIPHTVSNSPPELAASKCCPTNDDADWWAKSPTFLCGCHLLKPTTIQLTAIVVTDAAAAKAAAAWYEQTKRKRRGDVVVVALDSEATKFFLKDTPFVVATPESTRADAWNAVQFAARNHYARAVFADEPPTPDGIAALNHAFDDEHATLAFLNEDHPAEEFKSSSGKRVAISTCLFGLHLDRLERFQPRLTTIFDSVENAPTELDVLFDGAPPEEAQSHPLDSLLLRMLAAHVTPTPVRGRCARPRPLAKVVAPVAPRIVTTEQLASREKRAVERSWPTFLNVSVFGCDYHNNHLEVQSVDECKTRCHRLERCKAFSYLKHGGVCYFKTCRETNLRNMSGVDTYVKHRHSLAPAGSSCPKTRKLRVAPENPAVAVVVTVHDALEWVERCLAAMFDRTEDAAYGLYLVNDGSASATLRGLERLVDARGKRDLVRFVNWRGESDLHGYTRAVNAGPPGGVSSA